MAPSIVVLRWSGNYLDERLSADNHQGQLSLPSLRGKWMEYRPVWLGLRWGAFTCVKWQITLCDSIWQVTLRSCEIAYYEEQCTLLSYLTFLPCTARRRRTWLPTMQLRSSRRRTWCQTCASWDTPVNTIWSAIARRHSPQTAATTTQRRRRQLKAIRDLKPPPRMVVRQVFRTVPLSKRSLTSLDC